MVAPNNVLHVHDLPQIYQNPPFDKLKETLESLKIQPFTFTDIHTGRPVQITPEGVPRYLTSIISSSLSWLDEESREQIWSLASSRLSERSGRTAMPSMTRTFDIKALSVTVFEPSLTEDNLGLKTWTSSLLLARRLDVLRAYVPACERVLELGAGTGVVGIAAACLWGVDVVLTDLSDIVPNLRHNVESNSRLLETCGAKATVQVLDWADPGCRPAKEEEKYEVILAADPIYTKDHPKMLVDTVEKWIDRKSTSRFIVELPIRDAYREEREDLRARLGVADMVLVEEGTETGYDDWEGEDGQPAEVVCWWSVWKPSST